MSQVISEQFLSCFCSSVYSSKKKQLVIAPLTAEEFYNGQAGYFDKRINAICPGHDYRLFCAGICPYCGKSSIQSSKKGFTIKEYCANHPNTLMIYHDGTVRILKDELGATDDSFLDAGFLKIGNISGECKEMIVSNDL